MPAPRGGVRTAAAAAAAAVARSPRCRLSTVIWRGGGGGGGGGWSCSQSVPIEQFVSCQGPERGEESCRGRGRTGVCVRGALTQRVRLRGRRAGGIGALCEGGLCTEPERRCRALGPRASGKAPGGRRRISRGPAAPGAEVMLRCWHRLVGVRDGALSEELGEAGLGR